MTLAARISISVSALVAASLLGACQPGPASLVHPDAVVAAPVRQCSGQVDREVMAAVITVLDDADPAWEERLERVLSGQPEAGCAVEKALRVLDAAEQVAEARGRGPLRGAGGALQRGRQWLALRTAPSGPMTAQAHAPGSPSR
jgi:hypothetical protein